MDEAFYIMCFSWDTVPLLHTAYRGTEGPQEKV